MFTHVKCPTIQDISSTTIPGQGRWYITPEGKKYPSITTVLGQKEKPWLDDWKKALGPTKAKKEQQRCADRGTAVHEMIEHYLNNEDNVIKGYEAQHVRNFNQIKMRLSRIDNIYAQEIALWSDRLGVAGRVDCIAEYDGQLSIIDFKTSNNNKTTDMIEDYWLQATAYAIMFNERTGIAVENLVILMNVENGLVPLEFKDTIDKYVKPLIQRVCEYRESI